jgi:hypothetical protein
VLADKLGRRDGIGGGAMSNKNMSDFFRRPSMLEEERMYWLIIRKIVDWRGGGKREEGGEGIEGGEVGGASRRRCILVITVGPGQQ